MVALSSRGPRTPCGISPPPSRREESRRGVVLGEPVPTVRCSVRHLQGPVSAVALAALVAGGMRGPEPRTSSAAPVTLVPREGGAPKEKGELLAVDQGRIWVRTKDGVRDFDPGSLREVRVRRHNLTGGWAVRWGLVGGLASGVALAAACSSVEGNGSGGCAAAGAVWGGPLGARRAPRRAQPRRVLAALSGPAERPAEALRAPPRRPPRGRGPAVARPGTARPEAGARGALGSVRERLPPERSDLGLDPLQREPRERVRLAQELVEAGLFCGSPAAEQDPGTSPVASSRTVRRRPSRPGGATKRRSTASPVRIEWRRPSTASRGRANVEAAPGLRHLPGRSG